MAKLSESACTPCRKGDGPISDSDLSKAMEELSDWTVVEDGGTRKLTREYKFRNFRQALDFTNRVGEVSEAEDHHPLICTEWGRVTVTWWTHTIADLHHNDLVMAARADRLFGEQ